MDLKISHLVDLLVSAFLPDDIYIIAANEWERSIAPSAKSAARSIVRTGAAPPEAVCRKPPFWRRPR
jgi:hypothetical protein